MNRVRSKDAGYTIVETMIFLAVSGLLFISAMLVVNGQERKTQFSTEVREFDSKLQSVMGNITTGYYDNTDSGQYIRCDNTGAGGSPNPALDATDILGQNGDCIYVGQIVELVDPTSFTITSYAGLRRSGGKDVTNWTDAKAVPIADTTETLTLPRGLTAKMVTAPRIAPPIPKELIDTIGFITTFAQINGEGLTNSGSSGVNMIAFEGGPLGTTVAANPEEGLMICLAEGDTPGSQVGVIRLKNGGSSLAILTITTGPADNPCVI